MRKMILAICIMLCCIIPLAKAIDVGYEEDDFSQGGVIIQYPVSIAPINYSQVGVNSSDYWDDLDLPSDITESIFWINWTLAFNWTQNIFNTYDVRWTDTYNSTYEQYMSINWTELTFNEYDPRWTSVYNASYEGTYNSTYDSWKYNITLNYSIKTYDMWDVRWTATYNLTYDNYKYNLSINWSYLTFNEWDARWTDTFNQTYDNYAYNVSRNWTDETFQEYDERWTDTYNASYENKTSSIHGQMWNNSQIGWIFPMYIVGRYENLTNITTCQPDGFNYTQETRDKGGTYMITKYSGVYFITWNLASIALTGVYHAGIGKNFQVNDNCFSYRSFSGSIGSYSSACLLHLNKGDKINFMIADIDDPIKDITIHSITITAHRIGTEI